MLLKTTPTFQFGADGFQVTVRVGSRLVVFLIPEEEIDNGEDQHPEVQETCYDDNYGGDGRQCHLASLGTSATGGLQGK